MDDSDGAPARSSEHTFEDLQAWYDTPLGRLTRRAILRVLDDLLPYLFGYHGAVIGAFLPWAEVLEASKINHRFSIARGSGRIADAAVRADYEALPLASESLDLAVVLHGLEVVTDPAALIDEVERVLLPEGNLIVVGFNPFSLWGVPHMAGRIGKRRATGRLLSQERVLREFDRAGFALQSRQSVLFRPPLQQARLLGRLAFMEPLGVQLWPLGGGVYIMHGRKRVATLTQIPLRWRSQWQRAWGGSPAG